MKKSGRKTPDQATHIETSLSTNIPLPPIVGIGASAGGLAALQEFFDSMPRDCGMAFVIVQHLSPDFRSRISDLLSRHTKMFIHSAQNGVELKANSIYLIPPRQLMTIADGCLYLEEHKGQLHFLPVDIFFSSLAGSMENRSVGIVLSGTGPDGSLGIQAISEAGGLVLVQSPESAQFDGMPRAAINTDMYDYIAAPAAMPALILDYFRNPADRRKTGSELKIDWEEGEFAEIFAHLRRGFSLDFSKYKPTTVGRRISRRLVFHHFDKLSEYIQLLSANPDELDALYHELLIGVTEFFRDPESFAILEQKVFPELFRQASPEGLRVWVAACATGEEAYTLAIMLQNYAEETGYTGRISVFATDVHRKSLDFASQGIFNEQQMANVSTKYLDRYFVRIATGKFRVSPQIRKLVIFAPQNIISDPPFTRIDLLCCRNLLIYLSHETQEKTISAFNFSLRMEGILFLGISEGVGKLTEEFSAISISHKIYKKRLEARHSLPVNLSPGKPAMPVSSDSARESKNSVIIGRQVLNDYQQIINHLVPAGVLLDEQHHILAYFGEINKYLKPPSGIAEVDFPQLVNDDLHLPVTIALQRAAALKQPMTLPNVPVVKDDISSRVDVMAEYIPYDKTNETHFLVSFTPVNKIEIPTGAQASQVDWVDLDNNPSVQSHILELEQDLKLARENLQATVEELQTSNEELQSINEELLASNEELQSTNEELHSLNEELYNVNAEYEKKNTELQMLNDDHIQLLASLDVGVVFLDEHLVIRRFNPASTMAFKLLPRDIGRPISHIAYHMADQASMMADLQKVLETGRLIETEVKAKDDRWFIKKIIPYVNERKDIAGVLLTYTDVTGIKNDQARLRTLFELLPVGVSVMDKERNVVDSNSRVENIVALKHEDLMSGDYLKRHYIHQDGSEMSPDEFASAQAFQKQQPVYDVETGILREDGSLTWASVSAAPLPDGGIIVVTAVITQRKEAEQKLAESADRYHSTLEAMQEGVLLIGTDWRYLYMNKSAEEQGRRPAKELLGETVMKSWPGIETTDFFKLEQKVMKDREPAQIEASFIFPDGETRWFQWNIQPAPEGLMIVTRDITERKQIEEKLRESNQRFLQIASTINDVFWIYDFRRKEMIYFSPGVEEKLGLTAEYFTGDRSLVFAKVFAEDQARLLDLEKKQALGQSTDSEYRMVHKDGSFIWIHSRTFPVFDENGLVVRTVGIASNITSGKLAEQKLHLSEERLKVIVNHTPDHIVVMDRDLRYTQVINPQLGLTESDMVGKTDAEFLSEEEARMLMNIKRRVLETDDIIRLDTSLISKSGTEEFFEGTFVPTHDTDNTANGLIGYFRNVTERKLAERKLHASEEKYHLLFERVKNGYSLNEIITDKDNTPVDYKIIDVNIAFENIFGLGRQELLNTRGSEFKNTETDQWVKLIKICGDAALKGIEGKFELYYPGSDRYYLVHIYSHERNFFAAIYEDITERKNMEGVLRNVEEKYFALFNTKTDITFLSEMSDLGKPGKILEVNDKAVKSMGYKREELLKLSPSEIFVYPLSKSEDVARQFLVGNTASFEHTIRNRHGKEFPAMVQLYRIPSGDKNYVIISAHDITGIKKAEKEALESKQLMNGLMNNVPVGVVIADADMNILWRSQAGEKIPGFNNYENIRKTSKRNPLYYPDSKTPVPFDESPLVKAIRQDARLENIEVELRRQDGTIVELSCNAVAIKNDSGNIIGGIMTYQDITSIKNREEEISSLNKLLLKRTEELEISNHELESFSYSVSHDLRAPLRHISGFSRLLTEYMADKLDREGETYLQRISGAAILMSTLIDNILKLSRVTRAGLNINRINLSSLFRSISEEKRSLFPGRKINIIVHENLIADCDVSLMGICLNNLFENAWKFTSLNEDPVIEFGKSNMDGNECFFVRDNGVGFDMRFADKLFIAFQRLHNPSEFEGTGIGLAIVHRVISKHGGRIWADSKIDKGSTFYFILKDLSHEEN
jgi:PAS domain S-box-containing protein